MESQFTVDGINAKMELVLRILRNCITESERPTEKPKTFKGLLKYYAGVEVSNAVARRINQLDTTTRTYECWLTDELKTEINCDLEELKQHIYELYTKKSLIPTRIAISMFCETSHLNLEVADRYLKREHFTWVPLPKAKDKCLLVEEFGHVSKRYIYLQKIIQYRKEERSIFYIDDTFFNRHEIRENVFIESDVLPKMHILMISDGDRLFDILFNSGNVTYEFIELFVMSKLPLLPPGSVLVMGERKYHTNTVMPGENSKKSEMIDWLVKKNIPHDEQMHRGELYELIKISKADYEPITYALDEVLRARGFTVLRRPFGMNKFSFFYKFLFEYDKAVGNQKRCSTLKAFQNQCTSRDWMDINDALIELEKVTYESDMLMETATDQLMTFDWHNTFEKDKSQILQQLDSYILDPCVIMRDYVL